MAYAQDRTVSEEKAADMSHAFFAAFSSLTVLVLHLSNRHIRHIGEGEIE